MSKFLEANRNARESSLYQESVRTLWQVKDPAGRFLLEARLHPKGAIVIFQYSTEGYFEAYHGVNPNTSKLNCREEEEE